MAIQAAAVSKTPIAAEWLPDRRDAAGRLDREGIDNLWFRTNALRVAIKQRATRSCLEQKNVLQFVRQPWRQNQGLHCMRHQLLRVATVSILGIAILSIWLSLCLRNGSTQRFSENLKSSEPPHSDISWTAIGKILTIETSQKIPVVDPSKSNIPPNLMIHQKIEDSPAWAIQYGKEFWRRPAKLTGAKPTLANGSSAMISSDIDLGDIIDRVSHAIMNDDTSLYPQVKAKTYTATFDGAGVRFSPYRPAHADDFASIIADDSNSRGHPEAEPGAEAVIRTVSIRQGEQILHTQGTRRVNWSLLGNTAQAFLNPQVGVIEHYEATHEGVEISWVLNQKPHGPGPVEFVFEVSGLDYAGKSENGHHFADAEGIPRLLVGNAVAVDITGSRWDVPVTADGNVLLAKLSESILARAIFPLAIDPVIGPEFGIDTPVVVPSPYHEFEVAVASDGSDYLVVWTTDPFAGSGSSGLHTDIYASRVTKTGNVLDLNGIAVATAPFSQNHPSVAWNGAHYVVVWQHGPNQFIGEDIYGARVATNGFVLEPVGFPVCVNTNAQRNPVVAASNGRFIVAWEDYRNAATNGTDIYATLGIDGGSGAQVSDTNGIPVSIARNDQVTPAIAASENGFFVVWADIRNSGKYDIYGCRLTVVGEALDSLGIPICSFVESQGTPAVAGHADEYFIVWEDHRDLASTGRDIYGTRVTSEGIVVSPNGQPICNNTRGQSAPAVAPTASEYVVVWQDVSTSDTPPDIYGARVAFDGSVLDAESVPLTTANGSQAAPAIASNGSGCLVTWEDSQLISATRSDIWSAVIGANTSLVVSNRVVASVTHNSESSPTVSFNGNHYLLAWEDTRNTSMPGTDIFGVRLNTNGEALDPAGIAISTAARDQRYPAVAASGREFLVVWEDYRENLSGSALDIYGSRVDGDGKVSDPNGIKLNWHSLLNGRPVLASNGTNYLVVWSAGEAAIIDRTGLVVSYLAVGAGLYPSVASDGKDYLVVWGDGRESFDNWDIYGARVSSLGAVVETNGFPICTAPSGQYQPSIAYDGVDYTVVWTDERSTRYDIYATGVTPAGQVTGTNGFPISVTSNWQWWPAIAANARDMLVVWSAERNIATNDVALSGALINSGGSISASFPITVTDGLLEHRFPSVTGGPAGEFLVVSQSYENGALRIRGNFVSLQNTAPRLQSIIWGLQGVNISWSSKPGKTYRLEITGDLGAPNWTSLPGDVTATGNTESRLDDTIATTPLRFYRVLELP